MKAAIRDILDIVGQTMEETAAKVGDDVTPKVLKNIRKWVETPA